MTRQKPLNLDNVAGTTAAETMPERVQVQSRMMRMGKLGSNRGFTLIELLIILLLASAVLVVAGSYRVSRNYSIDLQSARMSGALRLARSKAVLRSRAVGVKFDVANNSFRIFDDVGPDGLGPGDLGYAGPDSGEANGDYDPSEPAETTATDLGNAVVYGFAVDDEGMETPDGPGTTLGLSGTMDPVPAANDAIVFGLRGRPTTPMTGNPPPYFVYIVDVRKSEMRAVRVDPWTGAIRSYKWAADPGRWTYQ